MDRSLATRVARFAFALIAAAAAVPTRADGDVPLGQIEVRGSPVPVYRVGEVVARANGMDDFAIRLAYEARQYTQREGVEACAQLCRSADGTRWGATLITIDSHAACPRTELCPAGFAPTGVDLHTHIGAAAYRPSDVDRIFLRMNLARGQWAATDPGDFSPDDLATGPGYLVTRYRLLHHDGLGRIRRLRDMRQPPPAAD